MFLLFLTAHSPLPFPPVWHEISCSSHPASWGTWSSRRIFLTICSCTGTDNWSASVPGIVSEVQDPRFQAWRCELPDGGAVLVLALPCVHLWLRLQDRPAGGEVSGTSRHVPCHVKDRVCTEKHKKGNPWAKGCLWFHSKMPSRLPLALQEAFHEGSQYLDSLEWTWPSSPLVALNAGRVVNNSKCGRACAGCVRQHVCT